MSNIDEDGVFEHPELISIGESVSLLRGYQLQARMAESGSSPKIIIGDNCWCNRFFRVSAVNRIELKKNVLIGPNVYLSDGGTVTDSNRIELSESCWLGANAVVLGHVRIGRGSVIGANSLVLQDVPDYSVAAGIPAVVTRLYDTVSGEWVRVNHSEEAAEVLANRRRHPLLSICLTACGSAMELENCLQSIYAQIDVCDLIEVCVGVDLTDTDDLDIIDRYKQSFSNLSLIFIKKDCVDTNPLLQTMAQANGSFLIPLIRLIRFEADKLIPFLNVLHHHRSCCFIWVNGNREHNPIPVTEIREGYEAFVCALSEFGAAAATIAVAWNAWQQIPLSLPFAASASPVQWVPYLLSETPAFCLYNGYLSVAST